MWYFSSETEHFFSPMVRNTDSQILIMEKKRYQRQVDKLRDFTGEITSVCCEYKRKLPISSKEMKTPH